MKIIITEEQNEKVNRKIRLAVEKLGLEQARGMMGDELIKQGYIDNPLSYLDQFNDLSIIEKDDKVIYVDQNNIPIFLYHIKGDMKKWCVINYVRVWMFFDLVMDYSPRDFEKVISKWLKDNYGLTKYKPTTSVLQKPDFWDNPVL